MSTRINHCYPLRLLARGLSLLALVVGAAEGDPGARPSYGEWKAALNRAWTQQQGDKAVDLICRSPDYLADMYHESFVERGDGSRSFADTLARFVRRRYDEAFSPPATASTLFLPHPPWEGAFGTIGVGRGGMWSDSTRVVIGAAGYGRPGPLTLMRGPKRAIAFAADVDLDGDPEVEGRQCEPTIRADLVTLVERAPDGRRIQWLVGLPQSDPRAAPVIWMYRDGCVFLVVLDVDGDGEGGIGVVLHDCLD